jgi:Mrp family chromosome partitioning ATPase
MVRPTGLPDLDSPAAERIAAREDARLAALGLDHVGRAEGKVHSECVRIARRLHAARQKVIGFIPASPRVAVPPLALQLGSALVELTGATVAFVDANVRYPALSAMAEEGDLPPEPDQTQTIDGDERPRVYRTRWLRGSLAVLTPPGAELAGEAVPQLARLLLDGVDLFEYVLVDLTGFDVLGEHASAAACMDAVALVGQTHKTRERDLLRFLREMPSSRFLGVMLVG